MKKILSMFALLANIWIMSAENKVQVGELFYILYSETHTAEVTYKSYSSKNGYNHRWRIQYVEIPTSINYKGEEYKVNGIGKYSFFGCEKLFSVRIPESVRYIGAFAFSKCHLLTNISIPDGVKNLDNWLFNECVSLRNINIPIGVRRIGNYTFSSCSGLTEVYIPNSVETIGEYAFSYCKKLRTINIPYGMIRLEGGVFSGCSNLQAMEIPSTIKYIGYMTFAYCNSMTNITIPSSVTYLSDKAFLGCHNIKELHYPKNLLVQKSSLSSITKLIPYDGDLYIENSKSENPSMPPLLELVEGSVMFSDETKNERIDGEEKCSIRFKIKNIGKGPAKSCEARVKLSGEVSGINVSSFRLPFIAVDQIYNVEIPVSSDIYTKNGYVTFTIEIYEPNGWGIAPFNLTVATKTFDAPFIQIVDYNIASNSGKVRKMEKFTLSFNLQNTKYGTAEDVVIKIHLPQNVFVMDGKTELSYPLIKSGEAVAVQIVLAANNNYSALSIPIAIDIKEKYGLFSENKKIDIALNQVVSSNINIAVVEDSHDDRREIKLAMLKSEVDRNIPVTNAKNNNAFVLIIANEHYSQVAPVPFALNDGNIFREYCIKTLGIGEKHIKYLADATGNQIKAGVNWLANLTEAFDNPQIIVYYAGHGIPDETNKSAYLLPVDGSGTDVTTGYKLDDLYATLGNMPASRIAVFMDACFSGSKREDGMLASARGVALKAKSGVPQGNMVVFSAAQGDETAYPNREQQHGLFTYYLLKKLQETEGNVALKELGDYVTKQVSQQSLLLNSKKQTPSVTPSASLGSEWQTWKLK